MRLPCRALSFLVLAPALQAQTQWYVDDDGTPPGSGSLSDPYTSIQYAIDQPTTVDGDSLLVAGGTYAEDLDLAGKALSLIGDGADRPRVEGQGGADAVVLAPLGQPQASLRDFVLVADASGSQRVVQVQDGAHLELDGVVLAGGLSPFGPDPVGGQVKVLPGATLVVRHAELQAVADIQFGGALAADQADVELWDSTLRGVAGGSQGRGGIVALTGGRLFASACSFLDGFVEDTGDFGGAIALENAVGELVDCLFLDAFALQAAGGALYARDSVLSVWGSSFVSCSSFQGPGGAVLLHGGSFTITNSEFRDCMAFFGDGGAVYADAAALGTFEQCTFVDNYAEGDIAWGIGDGGAVHANAAVDYVRCLFAGNVAAGVIGSGSFEGKGGAVFGAGRVQSCTFFGNRAGDAAAPGVGGAVHDGTVDSSVVWRSYPAGFGPSVVAEYCDVEGGWPGAGNVDSHPRFSDIEGGLFDLRAGSICIDAGNPTLPLDSDGTPADQGAFAFGWLTVGASYCAATANSTGSAAVLTVLGSTLAEDAFLRLRATQLPVQQPGVFLTSQLQDFVPNIGGGMGNLCLGAPILRLDVPPLGGPMDSGDTGQFDLRVGLMGLPPALRPQPGETWNFQAWFRDVVGSNTTSNLTDGVAVTFS